MQLSEAAPEIGIAFGTFMTDTYPKVLTFVDMVRDECRTNAAALKILLPQDLEELTSEPIDAYQRIIEADYERNLQLVANVQGLIGTGLNDVQVLARKLTDALSAIEEWRRASYERCEALAQQKQFYETH